MLKTTLIAGAVLMHFAQPALAQTAYPNKPIRLVVPFAPGGSTDVVARILGNELKAELGQPVLIDNKPGAAGNIGGDNVAKSAPDGYTVLMAAAGPTVVNPSLYAKMTYSPTRDLAPVTMIVREHNLMAINPSIPAKNMAEFVAYAKSRPGQLNFGSPGSGTPAHLGGELLNQKAGISMTHVPYKGSGPAITDLIAGHISVMIDNMPALLPHVQSGKLRALAIASDSRASATPDLPTIKESGVDGYVVMAWKGLMVPAGTPREVIDKLNGAVKKILAKPDIRKRMIDMGAEPVGDTPEQFAASIKADTAMWAALVKSTGTRLD